MDKMIKKSIIKIVGISVTLLAIVIFVIGLVVGGVYLKGMNEVRRSIEDKYWTRLNSESFYVEEMDIGYSNFYYDVWEYNSSYPLYEILGTYKYNHFTKNINIETEEGKGNLKVLDYNDFHLLVEYNGKIFDWMLSELNCDIYEFAPFGENAREILKDYTAFYNIKGIEDNKIIATVPEGNPEYSSELEINIADDIAYEKLILAGYKANERGNIEKLNKNEVIHTTLTKEQAMEEMQEEKVYEFLWYNDKLEVEKIVFCSLQVDEMSEEEKEFRRILGANEWVNQEYRNNHLYDISLLFDISCRYVDGGYEQYVGYVVDYENMQIIFNSDVATDTNMTCDIIWCDDENLILKYDGKIYTFMSKDVHEAGPYFINENGEYAKGSSGKYRATKINTEKILENATFEELNVSAKYEVVSHNELTRSEALEKLVDENVFVYVWCDENLNITKLLFYYKEPSFMDSIISKEWYILSEVAGGDMEVMVFDKDFRFDYYSTVDMYVGKLCDYTFYEVMDNNQIKLKIGGQATIITVIECNGEELTIEYEGDIRTYVADQSIVWEQMYEDY